jgi:hypothetical protein
MMRRQLALRLFTPLGALLLNLFLAGILFITFYRFSVPTFLPCTRPFAKTILLSLGVTLILNLPAAMIWKKRWFKLSRLSLPTLAGLCLLALWLGSYSYAPQGLASGNYLHGFLITRQGRANEFVAPGAILSLRAGSQVGIALRSDLSDLSCRWHTLQAGALDDPNSCDTTYSVPEADYDILTVLIAPGCGLPSRSEQIKISILP